MSALHDLGFLNCDGARAAVRCSRLRRKLEAAQTSIAQLLDSIDHGIDANSNAVSIEAERSVRLTSRGAQGGIGCSSINSVESVNVREQELLEGADLVLQFFDAIRVSLAHGAFSVGDRVERKRRAEERHRLSGAAK